MACREEYCHFTLSAVIKTVEINFILPCTKNNGFFFLKKNEFIAYLFSKKKKATPCSDTEQGSRFSFLISTANASESTVRFCRTLELCFPSFFQYACHIPDVFKNLYGMIFYFCRFDKVSAVIVEINFIADGHDF